MNRNNLLAIGGGIVVLFVLLAGLLYWGSHPDLFPKKEISINSNQAVKEIPQGQEVFDVKEIKNFPVAVVSLQEYSQKYGTYYRFVINHPQKITYASSTIVVGMLRAEYGDGTSPLSFPVVVKDGIMYAVNGWGGTPYPLKETNWKNVYQTLELSNFEPVEHLFSETMIHGIFSPDLYATYKKVLDIERITLTNTPDEIAEHASVISRGVTYDANGPFTKYADIEILKIPENSGTVSQVEVAKRNRLLAGVRDGVESFVWKYGSILYPKTLDGIPVVAIADPGESSASFHITDEQSETTVAYADCSTYPNQEVGPVGDESLISSVLGDAWKNYVKSWGYSEQIGFDVISFTTQHEHCNLRVSGRFRLNMFQFGIQKDSI